MTTKEITTLEQARQYRFRRWAGSPEGTPYKEGFCFASVPDGGRSPLSHQCCKKNGFGVAGLYCKKHDPEEVAKKWEAKHAKWDAESNARQKRAERIDACVNALSGIADPTEALRLARAALEQVTTFFAGSVPHCPEETAIVLKCARALAALTPEQES